jgi:hypothetical protein
MVRSFLSQMNKLEKIEQGKEEGRFKSDKRLEY